MPKPNPNLLLVEGRDDARIIPHFMGHFIPWGNSNEPNRHPVNIKDFGGIEPLLEPGVIEAELKSPGLKALGVIIDANSDPAARWARIRERARSSVPSVPDDLPREGLVCEGERGVRFGVWLMPDNCSAGMMETFLRLFVVDPTSGLWTCVEFFCAEAKSRHAAPYKDAHSDKALIHSWLAVQNPPGQQLHSAIMQRILDLNSPLASPFVSWFRQLFAV